MKIVIACGGGFSSSHLVNHLNKEAKSLGIDAVFDFLHQVKKELKNYDVIMCCPHLKYTIPSMIKKYDLHNVPVYVIPPKMYGIMDAEALLKDAIDIVQRFKDNPVNPFYFPGEENILRVQRTCAYSDTKKTTSL